jgi:uncharacterized protein (TIGR03437 family)
MSVTPGSLITIFGSNLASSTASADTIPLSTKLGGVNVQINGIDAPLTFVTGGQVNAQLPWEVQAGTAQVLVTRDGTTSPPQTFQVAPFSPGIFTADGAHAIVINLDGTLALAAGAIPGLTTHPAKAGDTVIIYATGLGAVDSSIVTGTNSVDKLRSTSTVPTVLVGGVAVTPAFSGLTPQFVGVNQLNIVIPGNAPTGNSVSLQLSVGGLTTSNSVTMAIQ